MPDSQFENIHLSFMEDFLPVGMAVIDRARKGGASEVLDGFSSSDDPIKKLREEGSSSAKSVREKLDQISPGLGNPVVDVQVAATTSEDNESYSDEENSLMLILQRIDERVDAIENHLNESKDLTC